MTFLFDHSTIDHRAFDLIIESLIAIQAATCLCLQLGRLQLVSASRMLLWKRFIFTHERPARSNVHHTVTMTLTTTNA